MSIAQGDCISGIGSMVGAALFLSGTHSGRVAKMGHAVRYRAKVKLLDEWGNAFKVRR